MEILVGRLVRICFVSKNLGNPIIFTSMFYPEQESSFFKYFRMIQKANCQICDFTNNMFCTTTLFWSITNHPPPRERHFGHLSRHPLTCDSQKALETVCWMGSSGFEHLRLPFNTILMRSWVENNCTGDSFPFSSVLPSSEKKKMIPRPRGKPWVVWKSVSTLLFTKFK